jgi:hypothetical protein
MRKFVKTALLACLSVAAVPAILFGGLWLSIRYKTAQVDSFYQEHRLLHEMRAAVQKTGGGESRPAREALLQILPLGTDKEAAIAGLREEGLGCQPITDTLVRQMRQRFMEGRGLTNNPNDSRTNKEWVECQLETDNVMGYDHWIVDVEFEADGYLSDARVTILYLFL